MNEGEKFIREFEKNKLNEYLKIIFDIKILLLNFIPQSIHEVELKTKILNRIYEDLK